MSERQPGPYDGIARKWLALAERRRVHLIELRDTGRWRHYYTWGKLLEALRETVNTRNEWARLAGVDPDEALDRAQALDLSQPSDDRGVEGMSVFEQAQSLGQVLEQMQVLEQAQAPERALLQQADLLEQSETFAQTDVAA
jgi:uncharacterized repeat protein (TIGR03809 family)